MVLFSKVREIILIFIKMRWQSNMTTEDNCNQSSIETEVTAASRGHKFSHFYEAEIFLAWLLISALSPVLAFTQVQGGSTAQTSKF